MKRFRDGPFGIQGGGEAGILLKKNSLFPNRSEKNKMSSMKLKINSLFFIQRYFFKALFPGNYKVLQITQYLTCIEHVDLLLARSVLNGNYTIRKIQRNIYKD